MRSEDGVAQSQPLDGTRPIHHLPLGLVDAIIGVVWLATNGRYKATKAAETAPAVTSAQ
jgi:hypothetical protein